MVRVKTLKKAAAATLAAGTSALAWGFTERNNFQLREYTLPLLEPGVLRERNEFRILHVSDPVSYTHLTLPTICSV